MTKQTKPWTSGFCAPGNPQDSHLRCSEHPRDAWTCACASPVHTWDPYHPNAPRPEEPDEAPIAPPVDCSAAGFSGEGRCIEPAVEGGTLCEQHVIEQAKARQRRGAASAEVMPQTQAQFRELGRAVAEAGAKMSATANKAVKGIAALQRAAAGVLDELDPPDEYPPGWYPDLDEAVYHAHAGSLSVSGAKTLLRAPALYAWEREHPQFKRVFDVGSAAHKLALGAGPELVVVQRTHPPAKGQPERVEDADNYMSNSAKAHRDEIRAAGAVPVLRSELEQVTRMAEALRQHRHAMEVMAGEGRPEISAFAVDEETGVLRRGRFDWLGSHLITDYKTTTSADPQVWARGSLAQYGYDMQASWYLWLARQLGHPALGFAFVLQEKEPPYLVTVVEVDQLTLDAGEALNRRALQVYRDCEAAGMWPGYVPDTEHRTVSAPHWRLLEAGVVT